MKITGIRLHEVRLGLVSAPYRSAKNTVSTLTSSVIAVDTDENLTGWGEICPYGANYLPALPAGVAPLLATLAPALVGRDPRMLAEINEIMDRAVAQQYYVKTGIDYACWDLLGKSTGLPVHALLGGKLTPRLPLIGSIPDGAEAMRAAIGHYRSKGYSQFSLHLASASRSRVDDCRRVIESLDAGSKVVVDANQSWNVLTAVEVGRALEGTGIALEQPCRDLEQCAIVRRKVDLPMVLDEIVVTPEDCIRAASAGVADAVAIKIGRTGGISRARRICDAADALGIPYWIKDVSGSEIATAAIAHLAHSRPANQILGTLSCMDFVDAEVCDAALTHEDGCMFVHDDSPGLGCEPRPDALGPCVAHFR